MDHFTVTDSHITDESFTVVDDNQLFTLDSFASDSLKSDLSAKLEHPTDLSHIPVSNNCSVIQNPDGTPTGMILDAARGIVLSVTEDVGGQFTVVDRQSDSDHHPDYITLGDLENGSHIELSDLPQDHELYTGQLLTGDELVVGHSTTDTSQLFEVSDNTSDLVSEDITNGLHLPPVQGVVVLHPVSNDDEEDEDSQIGMLQVAPQQVCNRPLQRVHKKLDKHQQVKRNGKGGWPKGKRRKPERGPNSLPKAPATAYVLFAIKRRKELKLEYPDLSFPDATRMLGAEWSAMSLQDKDRYALQAEADKKRYVEELKAYQHSEAYQNFMKRKKEKRKNEDNGTKAPEPVDSESFLNELEEEGLYCAVCDQYFSSIHNRKEHIFGKQHLQNITGDFEKELAAQRIAAEQEEEEILRGSGCSELLVVCGDMDSLPDSSVRLEMANSLSDLPDSLLNSTSNATGIELSPSDIVDGELCNVSLFSKHHFYEPPDRISSHITNFMTSFMQKNLDRELEISTLNRCLEANQQHQIDLMKKIQVYKDIHNKLEQQVGSEKAYGAALATQIDTLRMVPMLFGVVNKWAMEFPDCHPT